MSTWQGAPVAASGQTTVGSILALARKHWQVTLLVLTVVAACLLAVLVQAQTKDSVARDLEAVGIRVESVSRVQQAIIVAVVGDERTAVQACDYLGGRVTGDRGLLDVRVRWSGSGGRYYESVQGGTCIAKRLG